LVPYSLGGGAAWNDGRSSLLFLDGVFAPAGDGSLDFHASFGVAHSPHERVQRLRGYTGAQRHQSVPLT
jgi:hypothetical protein